MDQDNTPPSTPTDANETTEEQRAMQDKLDHRNDDPDAPGGHQTREQIPDESGR